MHEKQNPTSERGSTPWWLLGLIFAGALAIAVFLSKEPDAPNPQHVAPTSLAPAPAISPETALAPLKNHEPASVEELQDVSIPNNIEDTPTSIIRPPISEAGEPIGVFSEADDDFLLGTPVDPHDNFVLGTPQDSNVDQTIGEPLGQDNNGAIGTMPNSDDMPPM